MCYIIIAHTNQYTVLALLIYSPKINIFIPTRELKQFNSVKFNSTLLEPHATCNMASPNMVIHIVQYMCDIRTQMAAFFSKLWSPNLLKKQFHVLIELRIERANMVCMESLY